MQYPEFYCSSFYPKCSLSALYWMRMHTKTIWNIFMSKRHATGLPNIFLYPPGVSKTKSSLKVFLENIRPRWQIKSVTLCSLLLTLVNNCLVSKISRLNEFQLYSTSSLYSSDTTGQLKVTQMYFIMVSDYPIQSPRTEKWSRLMGRMFNCFEYAKCWYTIT